jgi:hypothetical protein
MKRPAPIAPLGLAAALAAAVTIAACGSGAHTKADASKRSNTASAVPATSTAPAAANSSSAVVAFAKCMRASGVPNFPDQGHGGIEVQADPGAHTLTVDGVTVSASAYLAARAKCERYMPHQRATPAQQAQARASILRFSRCMGSHGVPNFPDPKFFKGTDGNQAVELPGINPHSPAFQTAAKACGGGPKK